MLFFLAAVTVSGHKPIMGNAKTAALLACFSACTLVAFEATRIMNTCTA